MDCCISRCRALLLAMVTDEAHKIRVGEHPDGQVFRAGHRARAAVRGKSCLALDSKKMNRRGVCHSPLAPSPGPFYDLLVMDGILC